MRILGESQILWEFAVLLAVPHVGKSVVSPRTFLTVRAFLWYNCPAVCGSSTWWPYGGVNGNLLQEGLCHMLCNQVAVPRAPAPEAGQETDWRAKQNLMCTRTQKKEAVSPQEADPDLPVRVQESLVEVWVGSGLLQGLGH